jgi:uncharacterized membrane protein (DUF2068 family)
LAANRGRFQAIQAVFSESYGIAPGRVLVVRGHNGQEFSKGGLRIVSAFEAAKGLLVLLAGFGVLALIHEDLHQVAKELVRHFHLNPASHYPHIFIKAAKHWTDGQLWALAGSALLYAVVRFVEAFGLWFQRRWAAWFGLLSGGAYVPIELFEITHGATWPKVTLLAVNAGVVGYLGYVLARATREYQAGKGGIPSA